MTKVLRDKRRSERRGERTIHRRPSLIFVSKFFPFRVGKSDHRFFKYATWKMRIMSYG